ncbi:MAG TPA: DUF3761 domain-containing protein [Solirubrobacteraceae bacterium]
MKRTRWALLCAIGAIALLSGTASGAGAAKVSNASVNPDGYGSYSLSVADTHRGSKLVLYVNGGEPRRTTVGSHGRAVFRYVELEGTGKLSFAEVRTRQHGGHYLAHLGFVRYFDVTEGHVALSATAPAKAEEPVLVEAPTVEPPARIPAPAPVEPACLNGTYVNSEGHTVCRPEESPDGPPAGATARCKDGTYSFSEHRSGTCSSHGGVAEWL